jgi:hypothetical protein
MPITFVIDPSKRAVYTTVTGALLEADPIQYLSDLLTHPDYTPGLSALVVCREVEAGQYSAAAVRRLARFTRDAESQLAGSRVAIVADQPLVYGLARMYQLLREAPYQLQVFRERAQAEAWLGCAPADAAAGRH